jgi:hypothetical protein
LAGYGNRTSGGVLGVDLEWAMIGHRKKEGQDKESGSGKEGKGLNQISGN